MIAPPERIYADLGAALAADGRGAAIWSQQPAGVGLSTNVSLLTS